MRRPRPRSMAPPLALALTLLLMGGGLMATAPTITEPVTDLAGALDDGERAELTDALVALREDTAVQMAVVVVETTGEIPIEDYAQELFDQWKGGDAERDDGLLLVLAMGDRRSRLHTGYGLETYIPDTTARQLLDGMKPHLRAGDPHGAILQVVGAIGPLSQGQAPPGAWAGDDPGANPRENAADVAIAYIFLMLGAAIIGYWTHVTPRPLGSSWAGLLPRVRRRWLFTRLSQWVLIPLLLWPIMPGPWVFGAVMVGAMVGHAAITRAGLALGARDRMFWGAAALALGFMAALINQPLSLDDANLSAFDGPLWTMGTHLGTYLTLAGVVSLLSLVQLGWDFPRLDAEAQEERLKVRKKYHGSAASWTEGGYQGHTLSSSGSSTDLDFGSFSDFSSNSSSSFSSSSSWSGGGGSSGGGGASSSW